MDEEDPFSLFCLLWKGIVINMLHLKLVLSIFTAFRKDRCGVDHWHLSADVPVGSGLGTVVLGNRQDRKSCCKQLFSVYYDFLLPALFPPTSTSFSACLN